jgi:hypothetical protein
MRKGPIDVRDSGGGDERNYQAEDFCNSAERSRPSPCFKIESIDVKY